MLLSRKKEKEIVNSSDNFIYEARMGCAAQGPALCSGLLSWILWEEGLRSHFTLLTHRGGGRRERRGKSYCRAGFLAVMVEFASPA